MFTHSCQQFEWYKWQALDLEVPSTTARLSSWYSIVQEDENQATTKKALSAQKLDDFNQANLTPNCENSYIAIMVFTSVKFITVRGINYSDIWFPCLRTTASTSRVLLVYWYFYCFSRKSCHKLRWIQKLPQIRPKTFWPRSVWHLHCLGVDNDLKYRWWGIWPRIFNLHPEMNKKAVLAIQHRCRALWATQHHAR